MDQSNAASKVTLNSEKTVPFLYSRGIAMAVDAQLSMFYSRGNRDTVTAGRAHTSPSLYALLSNIWETIEIGETSLYTED